jgi:hypothetical protein
VSDQLQQLQTAERFGKISLTTPKIRKKFLLPPSHLLGVLDERFTNTNHEHARELTRGSDFLVATYDRGARYMDGRTIYTPNLVVVDDSNPDAQSNLLVAIQGSVGDESPAWCDLDPAADKQDAYLLQGYTWWPEHAVVQRIADHDRLLTVGQQLLELVQSSPPEGRDITAYSATKILG